MNWLVIVPLLAVLLALRLLFRRRMTPLAWIGVLWVAIYVFLVYGFVVPIPWSVVKLFMGIVTLALLAFASADPERWQRIKGPLFEFMTERRYAPYLGAVVLLIPAAVAAGIYLDMTAPPVAPAFGRTVHPAPPDQIEVHDETIVLANLENPYRHLEETDPAAFAEHVERGREVYYENCFYCHGDLMHGAGPFAHGLNPIPTSFQDSGNIPMLRESFLFWRIAKGGPGLPAEGGPWDSAMPAWEKFLEEEDMWDVILFLYDFTDYRPRSLHVVHDDDSGDAGEEH